MVMFAQRKFTIKLLFLLFILYIVHFTFYIPSAKADEIEDLQKQIDQLNKARDMSVNATKPLLGQLDSLKLQLAQIQASLDNLTAGIQTKEKELNVREDKLATQQALLETRIRSYYIRSYYTNPLLVIFSSSNTGDLFRELSYRQAATREDKQIISFITSEVIDLLKQKEKLEKDKVRAKELQVQVDKSAQFLGGEIKKAQAYQLTLASQIATLSQKQQELIAAKLASLNIPRSAYTMQGGCVDDRNIDPGFSPRFAFFTYGVPNRIGLNQYGAWGRAKAGQDYTQILQAYYNFDSVSDANQSIQIHVAGNGIDTTLFLEDYMKRIYEVPDSWTDNNLAALKAQAIAARSYVLAYTNNGSSPICPSDHCQVFQTNPKGGNWEQAVNATAGKVMMQGGNPIKAWFSSTHGGYVFSSSEIGWSGTSWTKHATDTSSSVNSFSDLSGSAYDRDSPWFYCDWGARASYNKTAWLKSDEVADIVNVILLAKTDGGTQSHLSQQDKPNPDGSDTWDAGKVRGELQSRGIKAFSSVSSVSVGMDSGSGKATSVSISGDGGQTSINASDFKNFFNLRAPANIQIVGPLFNAEQR